MTFHPFNLHTNYPFLKLLYPHEKKFKICQKGKHNVIRKLLLKWDKSKIKSKTKQLPFPVSFMQKNSAIVLFLKSAELGNSSVLKN